MTEEAVAETLTENEAAADRATKAKPGGKPSRATGSPKGSNAPQGQNSRPIIGGGRIAEPLSPGECRRALLSINNGVSTLSGSSYQLEERDQRLEAAGDALADISKWLPIVRPALRMAAPITFVGAEASIMGDILREVPSDSWQRRLLERMVGLPAPNEEWEPEVVPGRDLRRAV